MNDTANLLIFRLDKIGFGYPFTSNCVIINILWIFSYNRTLDIQGKLNIYKAVRFLAVFMYGRITHSFWASVWSIVPSFICKKKTCWVSMNVSIFAATRLLFCCLLGKATVNKGIVHYIWFMWNPLSDQHTHWRDYKGPTN